MVGGKTPATHPRVPRVRPAVTAQSLHLHWLVDPVRAPWSKAARPRVGFASTSPTTRPLRADGRVPGGRWVGDARTGWVGRGDGVSGEGVKRWKGSQG
jgi:hypothetical protein